jgi:NAD(P)-dependent dehydrogenase (short-subunit alcohol dehydrogenase family)
MELAGAVALVTGGAGGLGAGAVRTLSTAGMKVIIADLAEAAGRTLADEIGADARFIRTDVTNDSSLQAAVAAANDLGPLRVAVSAHGGPTARSRVLDRDAQPHPAALFRRTMEIYPVGTFNVLRLCASAMAKTPEQESQQRRVIVNTASIAAFEGQIGQSDFAAAKSGVVGWVWSRLATWRHWAYGS